MSYYYRPAPMTFGAGLALWVVIAAFVYVGFLFMEWLDIETDTLVEHFFLVAALCLVFAFGAVMSVVAYLALSDWSVKGDDQ